MKSSPQTLVMQPIGEDQLRQHVFRSCWLHASKIEESKHEKRLSGSLVSMTRQTAKVANNRGRIAG